MRDYSVKFKYGSDLYDISEYVNDIKDIPYMKRNSDYTIITEGYDFQVASTYPDITKLEVDSRVFVYSGSKMLHTGRVEKKKYDYDKRVYKLTIQHAMLDLENVQNISSSIHTDYILPLCETKTINIWEYSVINHNNVITALFAASGYDLDWSTYYTETTMSFYAVDGNYREGTHDWYNPVTHCSASQLYYLPDTLYSLNQDRAYNRYWVENKGHWHFTWPSSWEWISSPNAATLDKAPDTLEVVKVLSNIYGYNFVAKESQSFYVVAQDFLPTEVTVDDDEKISYSEDDYIGSNGVSVSYKTLELITEIENQSYNDGNRWFPDSLLMLSQQFYINSTAAYNDSEGKDDRDNVYTIQYTFSSGSSKENEKLKWMNNLVPIYISAGEYPYLIWPSVLNDGTPLALQRNAAISNGVEVTIETLSKNIWTLPHLFQLQEITFTDLEKDTVELIYRTDDFVQGIKFLGPE